jgi:hypothetical protein
LSVTDPGGDGGPRRRAGRKPRTRDDLRHAGASSEVVELIGALNDLLRDEFGDWATYQLFVAAVCADPPRDMSAAVGLTVRRLSDQMSARRRHGPAWPYVALIVLIVCPVPQQEQELAAMAGLWSACHGGKRPPGYLGEIQPSCTTSNPSLIQQPKDPDEVDDPATKVALLRRYLADVHEQSRDRQTELEQTQRVRDDERARRQQVAEELARLQSRFALLAAYTTTLATDSDNEQILATMVRPAVASSRSSVQVRTRLDRSASPQARAIAVYLGVCAEFAGLSSRQIARESGMITEQVERILSAVTIPGRRYLPRLAESCRADLGHLTELVDHARHTRTEDIDWLTLIASLPDLNVPFPVPREQTSQIVANTGENTTDSGGLTKPGQALPPIYSWQKPKPVPRWLRASATCFAVLLSIGVVAGTVVLVQAVTAPPPLTADAVRMSAKTATRGIKSTHFLLTVSGSIDLIALNLPQRIEGDYTNDSVAPIGTYQVQDQGKMYEVHFGANQDAVVNEPLANSDLLTAGGQIADFLGDGENWINASISGEETFDDRDAYKILLPTVSITVPLVGVKFLPQTADLTAEASATVWIAKDSSYLLGIDIRVSTGDHSSSVVRIRFTHLVSISGSASGG